MLPLVDRVKSLVLNLQFLWFVGHVITALHAVFHLLSPSAWSYSKAYYGALVRYI